jgi:peptidoglycan/LPS O-acetylase OafA/YrhL
MRNPLLDVLRLLAMCLVVAGHAAMASGYTWGSVQWDNGIYDVSLGHVGVTLFIILSGLSLHTGKPRPASEFYRRRLFRIYPTYWMALCAALLVGAALHRIPWPESGMEAVLTLTGFCAFAGMWGCQLTVSWFIGVIVALYLLYPWLAKALRQWPTQTLTASLVISVAARIVTPYVLHYHPSDWFPPCRLFEFVLGMYVAQRALLPVLAMPVALQRPLATLAALSFPIYLVHWIFLPSFWHWAFPVNLLAFVALTFVASSAIALVDQTRHMPVSAKPFALDVNR